MKKEKSLSRVEMVRVSSPFGNFAGLDHFFPMHFFLTGFLIFANLRLFSLSFEKPQQRVLECLFLERTYPAFPKVVLADILLFSYEQT